MLVYRAKWPIDAAVWLMLAIARRTLCTGAAAIMILFTDIYHLCYHIQSDISSCANCEMWKRKICLSVKCKTKCKFCITFFISWFALSHCNDWSALLSLMGPINANIGVRFLSVCLSICPYCLLVWKNLGQTSRLLNVKNLLKMMSVSMLTTDSITGVREPVLSLRWLVGYGIEWAVLCWSTIKKLLIHLLVGYTHLIIALCLVCSGCITRGSGWTAAYTSAQSTRTALLPVFFVVFL